MSASLRVTGWQVASVLDPAGNRTVLRELFPTDADLVVFPEAFARDFGEAGSDVSPFAEPLGGPFGTTLRELAETAGCTAVAGCFETSKDPARPFNTLLARGSSSAEFRKIHLYDSFGYRESDRLTPGDPAQRVVVDVQGWKVGLMTCYDLRFPELSRALVDAGAEVLVVPAAWVAGDHKLHHWRTLLTARAIENTVFVVGVGQPPPRYTGGSVVIDPMGRVMAEASAESPEPEMVTATLERDLLASVRRANPSLTNRRL